MLWAMAEQLENGDKTQAERDLRAAEQALREALNRGASDEEIRKLMQNLREAAQRFASEMARRMPIRRETRRNRTRRRKTSTS